MWLFFFGCPAQEYTSQPDMNDRDIPSVPVTTLAGLASVSDCKCKQTHFWNNRKTNWSSLLIFCRFSAKRTSNIRIIGRFAGEEVIAFSSARSRRSKSFAIDKRWCVDTAIDNGTRTNQCRSYVSTHQARPSHSTSIYLLAFVSICSELKPQYADQASNVTNMNELPHLLQAILQLKQNVFKAGGQQYQLQRPRKFHVENQIRKSHCIHNQQSLQPLYPFTLLKPQIATVFMLPVNCLLVLLFILTTDAILQMFVCLSAFMHIKSQWIPENMSNMLNYP